MPDQWGVDPDDTVDDLKYQVEPPRMTTSEKVSVFIYFTLLVIAAAVAFSMADCPKC